MSRAPISWMFLSAVAVLVLAGLLAGCGDNVSCVFTTGCRGMSGSGGIGTAGAPATFPTTGTYISNLPPTVTNVFPSGGMAHPDTPIMIVFSESMNEASLTGLFELVPVQGVSLLPPVPLLEEVLMGDGRVLILIPLVGLPVNAYQVRRSDLVAASPVDTPGLDLTGQALDIAPLTPISTPFTVPVSPDPAPAVIGTWPPEGATGISDTTEVVVVFDRAVDATTVDANSIDVTVDGLDPALDPNPLAQLRILNGLPTIDTRIYTWRSADAATTTVHATGGAFLVAISPTGAQIRDAASTAVVASTPVNSTISTLATPTGLSIVSMPTDAIGIRNLTAGDSEALEIQADLTGAQSGDDVDLFLFGTNTDPNAPLQIALRREQELDGAGPFDMVSFNLALLDLLLSSDPTDARFQDGPVSIAVRIRRGSSASPLHVLDVEPTEAGIQDPGLDLTRPVVTALDFADAGSADSASDLRDLVLTGVASEVLRSMEVSIPMGAGVLTNGTQPPMVGVQPDGRFIAAPVRLPGAGVLTGASTTYTAIAYDLALNASLPLTGVHSQRGVVGPGLFDNSAPVAVEVFDASTLRPVPGALVVLHSDVGGGSFPYHADGRTGADGTLTLTPADAPVGRLLTVDAAGFDLFTYHGITSNNVSVPLFPIGSSPSGTLSGTVTSTDIAARATLPLLDARLDDTRRPADAFATFDQATCANTASELVCPPYGPEPVRPGVLGATSLFAGDFGLGNPGFDAALLLQSFCLSVPSGGSQLLGADVVNFDVPFLLVAGGISELPVELAGLRFEADNTTGISLLTLTDDLRTTGVPFVSVETLVPGVPGTLTVGLGLAFENPVGSDQWDVRTAVPGAVMATGVFGQSGSVDTDFFIRCELRDAAGNTSGARTRLSQLPLQLPNAGTLLSANVPVILSPVANTGAAFFDITFNETIFNTAGQAGLYRFHLEDSAGRGWTIWTPDGAGDGARVAHVPDLSMPLGTGLADGPLTCEVQAFGWAGLALDLFLWSSVEQEHDLFARAAAVTFQQP